MKVAVTQTQFDALVSFDFSTAGIFRAKLTKQLNEGNVAAAGDGFDGWHRPLRSSSRRNSEQALFRNAHTFTVVLQGAIRQMEAAR